VRTLSADHARRIALSAMGLARRRPAAGVRRDVRHLRRVLDTVDVVQLDSVNVLARAHELPFWSRLGPHDRAARDRWLWHSRELFDGWVHVASLTSVDVWPLLHERRGRFRARYGTGTCDGVTAADRAAVLDEVAGRGPISVRDLADPGRRTGPWWGNPKGKRALEQSLLFGDLAIHHRTPSFLTVYDLTERVLPAAALEAEVPPREEAHRQLLLRAARAHGIGTAADLADHHRLRLSDARRALAALVSEGQLEEVRVRGWGAEAVYRHPDGGAARRPSARTLLSPFDPLVWFRERAERLFDFHYRIEIYVPAEKRVYGYYVLPFLLDDEIVARVDLKADRPSGRLLVRSAFVEHGADTVRVARELAAELHELGAWLEVPEVVVEPRGDLAAALARAVG
jgi:uncharacterized protein